MEKITKILENVISTLMTITIFKRFNIVLWVIGSPFLLITCSKIFNLMNQNIVKDSIFSVSEDGHIYQNTLASPIKMIKLIKTKDKKKIFIEEAKNMFQQLPITNNKNEIIKYTTDSHILTYKLLKDLETNGYVKNLEKIPYNKKKRLLFEKILIGNKKEINKKYQMYKITFELTEKKLINEEQEQKNNSIENTKSKELNEKTAQEQIQELKELKKELTESNNIENVNKTK